jgi:hypothetical protein
MMDVRIGKIRGDSRRLGNMAIQLASWRTVIGRHDSSGHIMRESDLDIRSIRRILENAVLVLRGCFGGLLPA